MTYSNFLELAFGLASLGTGILSLVLAIAVFLGNPNRKENRVWALTSLSVAVWGGGLGFAILSPDIKTSLLWNQVFYTGGVWIPTTFVWFVSLFTQRSIKRIYLAGCLALSVVLSISLWLRIEWFVADLVQKGPFRFWDVLGPAYHVFTVFFFIGMGLSCLWLFSSLKTSSVIDKTKRRWVAVGITCGVLGGSTNFFYNYNINIYPFGQFLVFLYPLLVSWAIIKHQALDIGLLIKRTGLFFAIYILLVLMVIPVLIFIHSRIDVVFGPVAYLIVLEILVVSAIFSLGPFIYALIAQRGAMFREYTIAGLAHELKSPLAAIESALDMLNDGIRIKAGKRDASYFEMIERNSLRLKNLVEDLIYVFGGERAALRLEKSWINFSEIIFSVCESYEETARQKGVRLVVESGVSCSLSCDKSRIEQVLSNLISNAVKFTDKGTICVQTIDGGGQIRVEVRDSGKGIGADEAPFVFDRFFQGREKKRSKGTGIGLTIAKTWIEAHNGEIGVESEGVDKGSRFWFTLPK